ncbi:hypothetical protein V6N11_082564 [Hibiscus sabdariffa]
MSALLLYRLLQKGYSGVMSTIMDEEAAEKQRKKAAAALQAAIQVQQTQYCTSKSEPETSPGSSTSSKTNVFQGVFCRDLAAVGNLLSQVGFNRPLQVKYEALSC